MPNELVQHLMLVLVAGAITSYANAHININNLSNRHLQQTNTQGVVRPNLHLATDGCPEPALIAARPQVAVDVDLHASPSGDSKAVLTLQSSPGAAGARREYHWPKLIHQTVKDRGNLTCETMELMGSWMELNPGYRHIVWDNADIAALVRKRYPRLRHMFESFRAPVERADMFRYLVLHALGGVYIDSDVKCLQPIDTWNDVNGHDAALLTGTEVNKPTVLQLNNWAIASMPHHPAFMRVAMETRDFIVSQYFEMLEKDKVLTSSEYRDTVLDRTGPKAWTRAVLSHIESMKVPFSFPNFTDNAVYGDVRVAPFQWLTLGWGETCEQAINNFNAETHPPGFGRPLVCHQFHGSWKDKDFAKYHGKNATYGCPQRFKDFGPRPEDFELKSAHLAHHQSSSGNAGNGTGNGTSVL